MAANIAKTSLSAGSVKEDLAVVDVYKQKNSAPINNQPVKALEATKAAEQYRNNPSLAKSALDRAKSLIPKDIPSAIDTIDRLSAITNGLKGSIADLPKSQLDTILGVVGVDPDNDLVDVLVDGQRYSNKRHKDVDGLTKLIVSITGNKDIMRILDLQGENAIYGLIIKQAIALGVPKAIDTILGKISDEKLKKKLMVENLETAARQSDLTTVNKVLDIIGVQKALAKVPNLINVILTFYDIPKEKKQRTNDQLKAELLALLNRINPKWHRATRNGVEIPSLEPFSYASKDAKTLLITENNLRTQVMIAPNYKSEHIMRLLRRAYPRAGFTAA